MLVGALSRSSFRPLGTRLSTNCSRSTPKEGKNNRRDGRRDPPFTDEALIAAAKSLKKGRAFGTNGIPAD